MILPQTAKSIILILSHQLRVNLLHRIHRNFLSQTPSKITVTIDLKAQAKVENNQIHLRLAKKNHTLRV